ncbi:hypothetical protein HDE_10495 [Halotydeus destructor]|nr:hypothetical protein HDE_10495 [Halotydeus destructor]
MNVMNKWSSDEDECKEVKPVAKRVEKRKTVIKLANPSNSTKRVLCNRWSSDEDDATKSESVVKSKTTRSPRRTSHQDSKKPASPKPSTSKQVELKKPLTLEQLAARPAMKSRAERAKLQGFTCRECEEYYRTYIHLTDEERRAKITSCSRHRDDRTPPKSPKHYWEVDFPSTPECIRRGYLTTSTKAADE